MRCPTSHETRDSAHDRAADLLVAYIERCDLVLASRGAAVRDDGAVQEMQSDPVRPDAWTVKTADLRRTQ
ncbi:hypothetical protein GCM10022225_80020 [Plantactinospora mayteni]|uniref:Uncharacterized protein n=1 Tax=Plantactinospora mayteni TaxID=566021 RepID=A0ABQ4F356_9ACTN|nr:hypothetical protein [Plantactinospora mayteni]GIH01351.1 hypothetical protein Pma05_79230 [Plantactinospora mayteni]